jgi:DNA topoisomerase IA
MAPQKILCVAEKPSIAKAVAQHLGGGRVTTVRCVAILLSSERRF